MREINDKELIIAECHDWAEDDSNFCPICGAKMVEPQESEG